MISKGIVRGDSHLLRCDDSYFSYEDETHALIAVFDGCSSSKYACVASQLMIEIMEHVVSFYNWKKTEGVLRGIYAQFSDFMSTCASSCKTEDYRTTLIVAIINKEEKTVETVNIGDGLIFIDNQCVLNSDTNVTDYMIDNNIVYNLNNCNYQEYSFENSVTISTDGLNSFKAYGDVDKQMIYDLFCLNNKFYKTENFVLRTCRMLAKSEKIINSDDIAIVKYIQES